MFDTKTFLASKTIWGAGVAAIAGLLQMFGYVLSPTDQNLIVTYAGQAVEIGTQAVAIGGALVAIYGRVRATKAIAPKA